MPRIKSKKSTPSWKKNLSAWTRGVGAGGRPTYAKDEYGLLYELEPVSVGDRAFYQTALTTGKSSGRVNYVGTDGSVSPTPVLHTSAQSALEAAVEHYNSYRRTPKHKNAIDSAFARRFNRV